MDNYCFIIEMCAIVFFSVMLCSSSWESKIKAITVRNQLFFPIIYYSFIHQDFTISYGNPCNYTDAVVAYAESKTFWIKHFEF